MIIVANILLYAESLIVKVKSMDKAFGEPLTRRFSGEALAPSSNQAGGSNQVLWSACA